MKYQKIGLVGIGKLGTAMLTHWDKEMIALGVYHPVVTKAKLFLQSYQYGYLLTEDELKQVDVLILALPATEVIPFITNLNLSTDSAENSVIINMATNLPTSDIKVRFPDLQIHGVKYMGHSRDLLEHGNGLFISESVLPENIGKLFEKLGVVMNDSEDCLTEVNKLATNLALRTAINIETEFSKRGLSPAYLKRALTSLAPEVIRSYSEGSLGHFAKEIVKEIQEENSTKK
ncbi:NAD(P)-binding domain-containing protein [Neobacillus drentensis]|uniref:NAD(P)-binding domain-containing protein n=1 Tax=Neobacillus drentensis TaxID=220684 RepID=UPI002FFE28B5